MAQLGTTLDPNAIEPGRNGFENMPDGDYVAQIIESSVKPTKNGAGTILSLTWEIVEGEFQNHKIWQNINYQHTSAQAQTIGQQQIKAICDAIGYTEHVSDSEVLHFQVCRVRVGLSKAQEGFERRNEIKAVKPYAAELPAGKPATSNAAAPSQQQQATQAAKKPGVQPAAKPPGGRPWANRQTA